MVVAVMGMMAMFGTREVAVALMTFKGEKVITTSARNGQISDMVTDTILMIFFLLHHLVAILQLQFERMITTMGRITTLTPMVQGDIHLHHNILRYRHIMPKVTTIITTLAILGRGENMILTIVVKMMYIMVMTIHNIIIGHEAK